MIPANLLRGTNAERVDVLAIQAAVCAVEESERLLGHEVLTTVSGRSPMVRSARGDGLSRWITVHVPPQTGRNLQLSRTEVLYARNLRERYRMALVRASGTGGQLEVRYAEDPLARVRIEDFEQHEFELPWAPLWRSAQAPR